MFKRKIVNIVKLYIYNNKKLDLTIFLDSSEISYYCHSLKKGLNIKIYSNITEYFIDDIYK